MDIIKTFLEQKKKMQKLYFKVNMSLVNNLQSFVSYNQSISRNISLQSKRVSHKSKPMSKVSKQSNFLVDNTFE